MNIAIAESSRKNGLLFCYVVKQKGVIQHNETERINLIETNSFADFLNLEANPHTAELIANQLHISISQAKPLHLNILIYTIGIGTIFSVTMPGISTDEIYKQQEAAYEALLKQALDYKE